MSNYCPRIHHGLMLHNIRRNSLTYAACCWATKHISHNNEIDFDHPDLEELRAQNRSGELPAGYCSRCISQESAGKHSMRQGYIDMHKGETYEPKLQYLDINIDYTCNLACVTCGPDLSTKWRNELKLPGADVRPDLEKFVLEQLSSLDLSQLKELRLWGGEPFLTNTHKVILNHVAKVTDPSTVKLMYNTNGTCLIDQDTKELIERFKFARISFSVDGTGEQFEYLRYPANWNQVEQNLMWWKNNLPHNSMLSITATASILNVLTLNQVFDWHQQNFSESKFGDPIEIFVHQAFGIYGLEYMPDNMIQHLKSLENYCQPWIQKLEILGQNKQFLNLVLDSIRTVDHRRDLDFAKVMPDTAQLIGYQK